MLMEPGPAVTEEAALRGLCLARSSQESKNITDRSWKVYSQTSHSTGVTTQASLVSHASHFPSSHGNLFCDSMAQEGAG